MPIIARLLSQGMKIRFQTVKTLSNDVTHTIANVENVIKQVPHVDNNISKYTQAGQVPSEYRFVYPEFLPDPNPIYRNALRERLERIDMLARRNCIGIPEFYVGSVVAVTYSESHAPNKTNRFVGICVQKKGCGLRATFLLRNVVDEQGVEVLYNMYDPTIKKIECLRLEKRLDNDLLYLRDAPLEYSTVPFDMDAEMLPEGAPVPVNDIKVPLNPKPWIQRYERFNLKGVEELKLNLKQTRRLKRSEKPWEKYDLMKTYRETISEEEQQEIFSDILTDLQHQEIIKHKLKRKRSFVRPLKTG